MPDNQNNFREVPNIMHYDVKDVTLISLNQVQDYLADTLNDLPVREFLFSASIKKGLITAELVEISITIYQLDNYHAQFNAKCDKISLAALQDAYNFKDESKHPTCIKECIHY